MILLYDGGAVSLCMTYMCAHTPFLWCLVLLSSVWLLPCICLVDTSPTCAVRRTLRSPFGFVYIVCLAELLQPQAVQPLLSCSLILPALVECSHFWVMLLYFILFSPFKCRLKKSTARVLLTMATTRAKLDLLWKKINTRQNKSLSRVISFLDMACKSYIGQGSSLFFLMNLDFIKKLETQGNTVAWEHITCPWWVGNNYAISFTKPNHKQSLSKVKAS